MWQTCVTFGFYQTTDSASQPFGSLVPLKFYTQQCTDIFGLNMTSLPRVQETNNAFGADNPVGASRILFVNSEYDQWQRLSGKHLSLNFFFCQSCSIASSSSSFFLVLKSPNADLPTIYIKEAAHCAAEDPFVPGTLQSKYVQIAQAEISKQIGEWLK